MILSAIGGAIDQLPRRALRLGAPEFLVVGSFFRYCVILYPSLFRITARMISNQLPILLFDILVICIVFILFAVHLPLFGIAVVNTICASSNRPRWRTYSARLILSTDIIFITRSLLFRSPDASDLSVALVLLLIFAPPAVCLILLHPIPLRVASTKDVEKAEDSETKESPLQTVVSPPACNKTPLLQHSATACYTRVPS